MIAKGREMGNVIIGPWSRSVRFPLDEFLAQAQSYQTDIMATQPSVLEAKDLFCEEEGIWSDQCDYLINTINTISEPIQEFCKLLDSLARLPVVVGSLRYPLMKTLFHAEQQINELILLLTLFRSICRTSSKKMILQRQEIQRKLELLVQSLELIDQHVDVLPEYIDIQAQILSKV
jgi:hypothetical protein